MLHSCFGCKAVSSVPVGKIEGNEYHARVINYSSECQFVRFSSLGTKPPLTGQVRRIYLSLRHLYPMEWGIDTCVSDSRPAPHFVSSFTIENRDGDGSRLTDGQKNLYNKIQRREMLRCKAAACSGGFFFKILTFFRN